MDIRIPLALGLTLAATAAAAHEPPPLPAIEVGGYFAGGGANLTDSNGGNYRAAPVTFTNSTGVVPPPVTGHVTVVKEDDTSGDPLAGATFQLWQETNGVAGLQTGGNDPDTRIGLPCVTGPNGTCTRAKHASGRRQVERCD